MANGQSPTVRRRRLASELRRLRENLGKTIEEVAPELDMSPSKLSRIETGRVSVRPVEVNAMLSHYGVTDERQREALVLLARQGRQKGWWQTHANVLTSEYSTLIGLEAEAAAIRTYQPQFVPGLLQTEDYARAVIRAARPTDTPDETERRVGVRMQRQARLVESGVQLWAIIDEAALHRQVGGPEIMREQLEHLVAAAQQPRVLLQVLPFAAGEHPALGSFVIIQFPDVTDPDVVYLENIATGIFVEEPREVEQYTLVFDRLGAVALPPRESIVRFEQQQQQGSHRE